MGNISIEQENQRLGYQKVCKILDFFNYGSRIVAHHKNAKRCSKHKEQFDDEEYETVIKLTISKDLLKDMEDTKPGGAIYLEAKQRFEEMSHNQ